MDLVSLYQQYVALGLDKNPDFYNINLIRLTHNSTSLEGSQLTEGEVKLLVDDGITPSSSKLSDVLMVVDHHAALRYVLGLLESKVFIQEPELKRIASYVKRNTGSRYQTAVGEFDETKGDYRLSSAFTVYDDEKGQRQVMNYLKPTAIPAAVKQFLHALPKGIAHVAPGVEGAYRFAARVHYNLRMIHPFGDGNSRTSRLVMNYVQGYLGYPLTPISLESKKDYLIAFAKSQEMGDPKPIEDFVLLQAARYFSESLKQTKKVRHKHFFLW